MLSMASGPLLKAFDGVDETGRWTTHPPKGAHWAVELTRPDGGRRTPPKGGSVGSLGGGAPCDALWCSTSTRSSPFPQGGGRHPPHARPWTVRRRKQNNVERL